MRIRPTHRGTVAVERLVSDRLEENERIARDIIAEGGQILLPFDAGDAEVHFASRHRLARLIKEALDERDRRIQSAVR